MHTTKLYHDGPLEGSNALTMDDGEWRSQTKQGGGGG